jgi:hypothetical protein
MLPRMKPRTFYDLVKAKCVLNWEDLVDWSDGLIAVLIPDAADACTAENSD